MASIIPIPSSRVTGLLTRQLLTQQYQTDQQDLFRLQNQVSTGQRIFVPSDDAPSAIRAISLQTLLNRKDQLETNINIGLQFLASTDSALGGQNGVADTLSKIKAATLGVIGTVTTQEDRDAAIAEINNTIESLVALGNTKFNGRYIFAGSKTSTPPYTIDDDGNVAYHGDDLSVQAYSDLGALFTTNATGQDVFGGISSPVLGTADLNPQVNEDTLLSSLLGGRGISPNGSIQIEDATTPLTIVDISIASTVGDVIRLIEETLPTGSGIEVAISNNGLQLTGSLVHVTEVGTGTTATELGIAGGPANTINGTDIDPQILKTTLIEDLLGTKARAKLTSAGTDNDILIQATSNGTALDGVTINLVDGGDIGDSASAAYDSIGKILTVSVDDTGETSANRVVDAINTLSEFTAELDPHDTTSTIAAGSGLVSPGDTATTSGGSGETLDQNSGIRVVNGGSTYDITFAGAQTVEDLLNILNRSEAGLQAEINTDGDGINIRSRLSGTEFQIGELGGTTATQLGVRTFGTETSLSDLNFGIGVPTRDSRETNITKEVLTITASDGVSVVNVDLSTVVDPSDLTEIRDTINAAATLAGIDLSAAVHTDGNSLVLSDTLEGINQIQVSQDATSADLGVDGGFDFSIPQVDFSITARDGQSFSVDLTGAESIEDVINLINTDPGNDDGLGARIVQATLVSNGNGISIVDFSGGAGELTVTEAEGSNAAEHLGLVNQGEDSRSVASVILNGTDRHFLENESVFSTLLQLREALENDDVPGIERASAKLDEDIQRVTFAQADVGFRFQALEVSETNLQDEVVQLRSALSEEIEVDLVEAISNLTARQVSLQASLQVTSTILQLSLLNFI